MNNSDEIIINNISQYAKFSNELVNECFREVGIFIKSEDYLNYDIGIIEQVFCDVTIYKTMMDGVRVFYCSSDSNYVNPNKAKKKFTSKHGNIILDLIERRER